ncbi:unnamed protein product [Dicrocoelium dendriticum]|nr:unnamed protein product [Dicrocoelium dendriticum]
MCVGVVRKRQVNCEYCPVGRFVIVHECNQGTGLRLITHVESKFTSPDPVVARCISTTHHEQIKCGGCLAGDSDRQLITTCKYLPTGPGDTEPVAKMRLITEYMVNEGGCCRLRRSIRTFHCDGCPPIRIARTACSQGYRLRHLFFFTRTVQPMHHSVARCVRRSITRKERCTPTPHTLQDERCFDQLTTADCKLLHSSGECEKPTEYTRKLCKRTCRLCS